MASSWSYPGARAPYGANYASLSVGGQKARIALLKDILQRQCKGYEAGDVDREEQCAVLHKLVVAIDYGDKESTKKHPLRERALVSTAVAAVDVP